jgi:hypothetical protein
MKDLQAVQTVRQTSSPEIVAAQRNSYTHNEAKEAFFNASASAKLEKYFV